MDGKTMISNNRRQFALGLIALGGSSVSNKEIGKNSAAEIDARIDAALSTW